MAVAIVITGGVAMSGTHLATMFHAASPLVSNH